jgi:hypothetical protein
MGEMSVEVDEMTIETTHRLRSTLLILMVAALVTIGFKYLVGERD